jgi:hypothetical protein
MCEWTERIYVCGHVYYNLRAYCHFARTDPLKQCFGPRVLRETFTEETVCGACSDAIAKAKQGGSGSGHEKGHGRK